MSVDGLHVHGWVVFCMNASAYPSTLCETDINQNSTGGADGIYYACCIITSIQTEVCYPTGMCDHQQSLHNLLCTGLPRALPDRWSTAVDYDVISCMSVRLLAHPCVIIIPAVSSTICTFRLGKISEAAIPFGMPSSALAGHLSDSCTKGVTDTHV